MASKKANASFSMASRTSFPTRFRCKVGGEWKPIDEFSKNQQRFIQPGFGRSRIDAANSGMTCKEHSSGQRTEMTCVLCGLTKPLSEFSGNSKRSGETHCKRCTAWTETQEPEVVPAPLETGHISIEEERGEAWPARFIDDSDFFSGDAYPQAPLSGISALGLDDHEVASLLDTSGQQSNASEYAASEVSSSRALPPHLRGSVGQDRLSLAPSTKGPAPSVRSSFFQTLQNLQNLPPHLRALVQQSLPDNTSDYMANSEIGDNPSSISTATTAREAREARVGAQPRRVSFNAWDADGTRHRGFKSATNSSATGTSEASVEEEDSYPPANPARGNWPKIVRMSQTELRQVGTNHHVAARDVGPLNHRPVHHEPSRCCEPDDDDGEDY